MKSTNTNDTMVNDAVNNFIAWAMECGQEHMEHDLIHYVEDADDVDEDEAYDIAKQASVKLNAYLGELLVSLSEEGK